MEIENVSVAYVIALVVVIGITLICLAATIILSVVEPHPTDSQITVMDLLSHGFTAGLGGLLGILGGKLA